MVRVWYISNKFYSLFGNHFLSSGGLKIWHIEKVVKIVENIATSILLDVSKNLLKKIFKKSTFNYLVEATWSTILSPLISTSKFIQLLILMFERC